LYDAQTSDGGIGTCNYKYLHTNTNTYKYQRNFGNYNVYQQLYTGISF